MPFKDLVEQAGKVYTLSKGSREVLKELISIKDEKQLLKKVLELENKPILGNGLTKSILDVLILVVKVHDEHETPKKAIVSINQLKQLGLAALQPSFFGSMISGTNTELLNEFSNFIQSAVSEIEILALRTSQIMASLQEQLAAKENELKKTQDKLQKLENAIQSSETIRLIITGMQLDFKLQSTYILLFNLDDEQKKEIKDIYENLFGLTKKIMTSPPGTVKLPNEILQLKIDAGIVRYNKLFEFKLRNFYASSKLILNYLTTNNVPTLVNPQVFTMCQFFVDNYLKPSKYENLRFFTNFPSFSFPFPSRSFQSPPLTTSPKI